MDAAEAKLPENVTPENSKLEDPEERAHRAGVRARAHQPSGFVLPIQRWQAQAPAHRRWRSERWKLRRGQLFLIPGDSPVGYRLPFSSLPFVPPAPIPTSTRGPDRERGRCRRPSRRHCREPGGRRPARAAQREPGTRRADRREQSPSSGARCAPPRRRAARRTAVRVHAAGRARRGLSRADRRRRGAAEALGLPVHIEGYAPPNDPR
jgi:uncharacterized protein (DUF2126 family)